MDDQIDDAYNRGVIAGLRQASIIVDEHLGDEHLKDMESDEFLDHLLSISRILMREIKEREGRRPRVE